MIHQIREKRTLKDDKDLKRRHPRNKTQRYHMMRV